MSKEYPIPTYNCPKVANPPADPFRLDDPVWSRSEDVEFLLTQNGEAVSKPTIAKMCWDDTNLYFGFKCTDTHVWGTLTERDDPIYTEDVVEVFLSPNGDIEQYFEFELSPLNVVFDAKITNVGGAGSNYSADVSWDCQGLQTSVFVDGKVNDPDTLDKGWNARIAIPFASLGRKTPKPGETWLGNLYRIDLRPEPVEFQAWSPTLHYPPNYHLPLRFGKIVFSEF